MWIDGGLWSRMTAGVWRNRSDCQTSRHNACPKPAPYPRDRFLLSDSHLQPISHSLDTMQATPAPTSPVRPPQAESSQAAALNSSMPEPPQNYGTAPFSILTGLLEKLQNERKRDRKEKLINAWFTVWVSSLTFANCGANVI